MRVSELAATAHMKEVRLAKAWLKAKIGTVFLLKCCKMVNRCKFWYISHTSTLCEEHSTVRQIPQPPHFAMQPPYQIMKSRASALTLTYHLVYLPDENPPRHLFQPSLRLKSLRPFALSLFIFLLTAGTCMTARALGSKVKQLLSSPVLLKATRLHRTTQNIPTRPHFRSLASIATSTEAQWSLCRNADSQ
jgi:hypothetical protein